MLQKLRSGKYLNLLINPLELIRTKKVLQVNPTLEPQRKEPEQSKIFVYDYNADEVKTEEVTFLPACYKFLDSSKASWINVDGLRKSDVEDICNHYGIHPLIAEDILS